MNEDIKKIIDLLIDIKYTLFTLTGFLAAILILIILFPIFSHASDPWTKNEKWTYGYFTALNIVDCGQTYYIYRSPNFNEAFPLATAIIEDKPENARYVPLMFIGSNLTCLGIAHLLPSKWKWTKPRQWFLSSITLFEVYAVGRNICYGVKWRIPIE